MLQQLEDLRIPVGVASGQLQLLGPRNFSLLDTNSVKSRNGPAEGALKQLQLPFGPRDGAVRLRGPGFEALKHAVQHLGLYGMRFDSQGLALEGRHGRAFLHVELFEAYSLEGAPPDLVQTDFLGLVGARNEMTLDFDQDQLVCGDNVLPLQTLAVELQPDESDHVTLGSVLSSCLQEFVEMCGPLHVSSVSLRFSGKELLAGARKDKCLVEMSLALEREVEQDADLTVPLFAVLTAAEKVEFRDQEGAVLSYRLGDHSYLEHRL